MGRNPLMALIDGDIILYQALGVTSVDFDGELVPNLPEAFKAYKNIVNDWHQRSKAKDYCICISSSSNFRKTIAPSYKSGRGPKPPGLADLQSWVLDHYAPTIFPNIEADDVMGILLTREEGCIAVSIDKDMRTVPGWHFNPGKDQTFQVHEDEANLYWMRQVLMGDTIDGYTGIPKIGPKRAEAILPKAEPLPVLWRLVLDAYETAKLDLKYAVATARLAYILRDGDYDRATEAVRWIEPEPCRREDLPAEYSRALPPSRRSTSSRPVSQDDRPGN
jgi:hypothetical protein